MTTLSQEDIDAEKLPVEKDDPTGGLLMPDQGFSHNPGKAVWEIDTHVYDKTKNWPEALQKEFLADMASTSIFQETFPSWVDEIREAKIKRGITKTIGWADVKTQEYLKQRGIELETPVIAIDDEKLIRAIREARGSRGAALTIEQIKQLPSYIAKYEAVLWDTKDPALLYVVSDIDKKIKTVVKINYKQKGAKERINKFITAGKMNVTDLKAERYLLIE